MYIFANLNYFSSMYLRALIFTSILVILCGCGIQRHVSYTPYSEYPSEEEYHPDLHLPDLFSPSLESDTVKQMEEKRVSTEAATEIIQKNQKTIMRALKAIQLQPKKRVFNDDHLTVHRRSDMIEMFKDNPAYLAAVMAAFALALLVPTALIYRFLAKKLK